MPELEGLELLMTVAKQYPETRIIAMSGSFRIGHIDFLEFAARLGASATLHKPFTQETLLGAIEQSMGATRTA
jgi:CheY-like chemotaxis protein